MESVTRCQKLKEWNGKPIYQIEMSNGAIGESFQDIPVGTPEDQLTFTKSQNSAYADRVKWNKPNQGGGYGRGGGAKGGNESFALAYAKDIAVAHIQSGKEFKAADVVVVAETFYQWMEAKKK